MSSNKNPLASMNRRDLLSALLSTSLIQQGLKQGADSPLNQLTHELLSSLIPSANAQTPLGATRLFVAGASGGLPLHNFTYPLTPNGAAVENVNTPQGQTPNFIRRSDNGSTENNIITRGIGTSEQNYRGIYQTVPIATQNRGDIHMPYLWGTNIPTIVPGAGGTFTLGSTPMSAVIRDFLSVRGAFTVQNDVGHGQDVILPGQPGGSSIHALVGEHSNFPISAIFENQHFKYAKSYYSKRGLTPSYAFDLDNTMLSRMVSPFTKPNLNIVTRAQALNNLMSAALNEYRNLANAGHPTQTLFGSYDKAMTLLDTNFGNLTALWNNTRAKYQALVGAAFNNSANRISGLFEHENIMSNGSHGRYAVNSETINGDKHSIALTNGFMLKDMITANSTANGLIDSFTAAETLFTLGLTGCFVSEVFYTVGVSSLAANADKWWVDEHTPGTGSFISLYISSHAYRAFAACLNELRRVLSDTVDPVYPGSIWENTVVCLLSEYSRNPWVGHPNGTEHAPDTTNIACWSGRLQNKTYILGNCYLDGQKYGSRAPAGQGSGTWGDGADVRWGDPLVAQPTDRRTRLSNFNLAETLGNLCRCPQQSPNNPSVLIDTSSGIVPQIEYASDLPDGAP